MPQLLLELLSEEIPARMQGAAARDLERMAREKLAEAGLLPEALKTFAGSRRLTLVAEGLPPAQSDRTEERKGPRANAPEAALEGFLRSTGLTREQLTERDGVYYASIARPGRPTPQIVAEMVESIVRTFPWPKSMTWGAGKLRWVRPLKRILCVFAGEIVPFAIDGIESGDLTQGHRFMGPRAPFRARDFDAYAAGLHAHSVELDVETRKRRILEGARTLCFARGLELVEDAGLLEEVAGLSEWPTSILGDMDPAFLDLPPEVIRTSMRTHQKYFAVRAAGEAEALAPHFLTVANIEAKDGGAAIAAGNARVLSARLNDARFFWDEDRKVGFEPWLEKLKGVTFHAKLGTMHQRAERIEYLARVLSVPLNADHVVSSKAAMLAKADLVSGMVGEFPELQGVMGGYYATASGYEAVIASAIRDHYKPQGPSDTVPTSPSSIVIALADKLDTLIGFFAINEKPTGSKDPFALRRAALGVIRIVLENGLRFDYDGAPRRFKGVLAVHFWKVSGDYIGEDSTMLEGRSFVQAMDRAAQELPDTGGNVAAVKDVADRAGFTGPVVFVERDWPERWIAYQNQVVAEILAFLADRLKVLLRDEGKRHDLVDAVFALGDDDLVRIVARVDALTDFLATPDGVNLLAGYKRASNILKAEDKKAQIPAASDGGTLTSAPQHAGLRAPARLAGAPAEETALIDALDAVTPQVDAALNTEGFSAAMTALASLRGPVDAFFDKVLVNSEVPAERANRLALLSQVRDTMGRVADFSLISG